MYKNTGAVSTGGLDGALVTEMAYVPLNAETLDLLTTTSDLDMRIVGKNTKYDMRFSADSGQVTAFAEAAKGLLAE